MGNDNRHRWPALAGRIGETDFFVALCPARFVTATPALPEEPQFRRTQLDDALAERLLGAMKGKPGAQTAGVFAVLVVGDIRFLPTRQGGESGPGWIEFEKTALVLLCDGFQRQAALRTFLRRNPRRANDSLPVIFYSDPSGRNYGSLFQALHPSARKATRSRRVMADAGDPVARVTRELLTRVREFEGLVEMNKATLAPRSGALFTVSALFQATRVLLQPLRGKTDRDRSAAAQAFWRKLFQIFEDWRRVRAGGVSAGEIRQRFIHSHGVVLDAVAQVAAQLVRPGKTGWVEKLEGLRWIDWSRANPLWEGRALLGGKVSKARQNVVLTAAAIKAVLGLPLTEAERHSESALQHSESDERKELAGQTQQAAD